MDMNNTKLETRQPPIFGQARHDAKTLSATAAMELVPMRGIQEYRLSMQLSVNDPIAWRGAWIKFGEQSPDKRGIFLAHGQSQVWVWPNVPQTAVYGIADGGATVKIGILETIG